MMNVLTADQRARLLGAAMRAKTLTAAAVLLTVACDEHEADAKRGATKPATGTEVELQSQALNALPLYQDPSGSQSVVQPLGSSLMLQGTTQIPTPKRVGDLRYAGEFPGTDIGAKINAAVADLGPQGGTVVVPAGSFTFSTPIVLDNRISVVLRGMGSPTGGAAAASSLTYNGACGTVISARSTAGVHISGLALYTSIACSTPQMTFVDFGHSAMASDSALGVIENCNLIGTTGTVGVSLDRAIEISVRGNNFGTLSVGVRGKVSAAGYSNVVRIEDNQFVNVLELPIKNAGEAWHIKGNTFEQRADGSAGAYGHDPGVASSTANFVSNWFGDTIDRGTWIDWAGTGLTVSNNYFGSASIGVRVAGTSATLTNNHFAGVYASSAIDISAANSGIVIMGNTLPIGASITRSTTAPMDRTTIAANAGATEYRTDTYETINVRHVVTKAVANSFCPSGSTAVYTPRAYAGLTGNVICAANTQASRSCVAAKFVYVTTSNQYGAWPQADSSCADPVPFPWPWGYEGQLPTSHDGDWSRGDTRVVCCQ